MGLIAGIYTEETNLPLHDILLRMMKCQAHRDKQGTPKLFADQNIAMGVVNRHDSIFCDDDLSIMEEGNRRLTSSNYSACVDGIILDAQHNPARSNPDGFSAPDCSCSDAVTVAYEKWGTEFMNHLEGQFSCAIWDKRKLKAQR